MIKLITSLGKLVARLYIREAAKLDRKARKDAAKAQELAKRVREMTESVRDDTAQAAKLAAKGVSVQKFFE